MNPKSPLTLTARVIQCRGTPIDIARTHGEFDFTIKGREVGAFDQIRLLSIEHVDGEYPFHASNLRIQRLSACGVLNQQQRARRSAQLVERITVIDGIEWLELVGP